MPLIKKETAVILVDIIKRYEPHCVVIKFYCICIAGSTSFPGCIELYMLT